MIKTLIIAAMVMSIALFNSFADDHKTNQESKEFPKCRCVDDQSLLSKFVLDELISGKTVDLDLSNSKSVVVFLDKKTVKNYNQVHNFAKWLEKRKMDINVYTVVQSNTKQEAVELVKKNSIPMALWDTTKMLTKDLKVEKYPMAYYIVNGIIVDKTDKITVGHLRQMVHMKEQMEVGGANKSQEINSNKKVKEKCSSCQEGCKCGQNCKCD